MDYLIFRKSRTKLDDGYDVVTTAKYYVISAQMTNLVVVVAAVVKSKALYYICITVP